MALSNVTLTPIQELAPGQVFRIRDKVIRSLVAKASAELSIPEEKLVVRDIRAYDDLQFGVNTDYMATTLVVNIWGTYQHGGATYAKTAANSGFNDAIPDNTTMASDRYVAIYGFRDWRLGRPSSVIPIEVSQLKFQIGNSDRTIWDLIQAESYTNYIAGITSSAIVIPPLAAYQIQGYLLNGSGEEAHIQLMGVVVEPAGLVITPVSRVGQAGAAQTQLVPVTELAPGSISLIRNEVINRTVALAASELNLPAEQLVVRDIRPYSDLAWFTDTTPQTGSAASTDTWVYTQDASETDGEFVGVVASANTEMADGRFVAIYGVKSMRMCLNTPIEPTVALLKIAVGGNDRVIWDLQSMDAYPTALAAVCPSAVVIPQNTDYQIYIYSSLSDDGDGSAQDLAMYYLLEGIVVERVGKVLSP